MNPHETYNMTRPDMSSQLHTYHVTHSHIHGIMEMLLDKSKNLNDKKKIERQNNAILMHSSRAPSSHL